MEFLGIDIGGSGIKGALVDIETGELTAERYRLPTPEPSKPESIAKTVAKITHHFEWQGPIGCGFPSALQNGVVMTAANVSKKWIGVNAAELFSQITGCPVVVLNDADVAGIAEMTFGAGRGRNGVVLIVTIGTGLGTALFTQGKLLPNAELGHVELNGSDAEVWTSDAARKRDDLTWKKWVQRFDVYLNYLEKLFWPELIILGGGASKKFDKFGGRLTVQAEVVPAQLLNEAGIVGAALAAYQQTIAQQSGG
ncbi:MAG: ROK family protein [Anaerolineales bacterium]|jgi:polyphosphate glucokinase